MVDFKREKKEELAAVRIILGSLKYQDISISATIEHIVRFLCRHYEVSKNKSYLDLAVMYIQEYLNMGFVYGEYGELFDQVFTLSGNSKEYMLPVSSMQRKKRISKGEIRSMIRRWSSSKHHTNNIDDVINDILAKVEVGEEGIYYYHSNERPSKNQIDEVYELVISQTESYLRDINRNKYHKLL